MTDRVSYRHGVTFPGPTEYSSVRIDLGVDSDLRAGETLAEAMERLRAFVHAELAREQQATPARGGKDVQDELFDIDNQVHRRIAANVMDHMKISPDRHEAKMKYVLKGKRVGDARQLLEADYAAYQAKQRKGRA